MPATEATPVQVSDNEPHGKSPAFNTMAEKLGKLMAPFIDGAKPEEAAKIEKSLEKPAKVQPVKPEELKPDEEFPESIKRSPKASEEFKKIKDSERKYKADYEKYAVQVKTLEGEIAKLKSAPAKPLILPPEFESLKKEREELSNQLKIASIERHPDFRKHFDSRTSVATGKATAVLGDDLTSKASKLAALPPSEYRAEQLDKMLAELQETSPSKAVFLSDLIRDINGIAYDRDTALKQAREDYDVVQKREQDKIEASNLEQASQREQSIALAMEASKNMESFKRGDDANFNESVDERERLIKAYLRNELDPKFTPFIPVLAAEAIYLKDSLLPSLREENAKLLKQIQEMTQSSPRAGETNGKPSTASQHTPGKAFMEKYLANKPQ